MQSSAVNKRHLVLARGRKGPMRLLAKKIRDDAIEKMYRDALLMCDAWVLLHKFDDDQSDCYEDFKKLAERILSNDLVE